MNWEAIGAIGELAGALAVFATLVYLAIQVRHARSEMQQSFRLASESAEREALFEQLRNPLLLSAKTKIRTQTNSEVPTVTALLEAGRLTDDEAQATNAFVVLRFRLYSDQIQNLHLLTEEQIAILDRRIKFVFSRAEGKIWFEAYESRNRDDETVRYIRKALDSDTGA